MSVAGLRITEIFHSLQGETRTVGLPTVFVRLTGCPLRCSYCDTEYAFSGGMQMRLEDIVSRVKTWNPRYVTVTGGEPLAQPNCKHLLTLLCDEGYEVSLETAGSLSIDGVDQRVSIVIDLKAPSSGESSKNLYSNLDCLQLKDQIKFVICDREDYVWAKGKIDEYRLAEKAGEILFSPGFGRLPATDLADWILHDQLMVRMQLQLHKLLWPDQAGR